MLLLARYARCAAKNANYASNNGMYLKRDNVRIKRIVLDLHVIVDSKMDV